jgi:hypothetical protein
MKTSLNIMFAPPPASNDMKVGYNPVIILCRVRSAKITLLDKKALTFIVWGLYISSLSQMNRTNNPSSYKTLESH